MDVISASGYRELFSSDDEFAVIDSRPIDDFYRGHLLASSNLPLARMEMDVERAIPCRKTRIVLCDWATAHDTGDVLNRLGYRNISVIEGGLSGWHLAGGRVYPGWNVIGKAFGDFVEKTRGTPTISAVKLKELIESDTPPLILDTRSDEEHTEYCIPGASHCPNGETVFRALSAIDDANRQIVTHCAGRTRGIIGAQTLIEAGVPNPVCSLGNGTLEWALEGFELETGAQRLLSVPKNDSASRRVAAALRRRYNLAEATAEDVRAWQDEIDRRGLYVFDIRTVDEYRHGTWPGAQHMPGGQLLQSIDRCIFSRGGRIVVLDTESIRAVCIAAWIQQMGYRNIFTFAAPLDSLEAPSVGETAAIDVDRLRQLRAETDSGDVTILDARSGVEYRRQHVSGAWFFERTNVTNDERFLPRHSRLVIYGNETGLVERVAADLRNLGRQVEVRMEPLDAWEEAGFGLLRGVYRMASAPHDAIYDLEEREVHVRDSYDYLKWRANLFEILGDDPGAPYMKEI